VDARASKRICPGKVCSVIYDLVLIDETKPSENGRSGGNGHAVVSTKTEPQGNCAGLIGTLANPAFLQILGIGSSSEEFEKFGKEFETLFSRLNEANGILLRLNDCLLQSAKECAQSELGVSSFDRLLCILLKIRLVVIAQR